MLICLLLLASFGAQAGNAFACGTMDTAATQNCCCNEHSHSTSAACLDALCGDLAHGCQAVAATDSIKAADAKSIRLHTQPQAAGIAVASAALFLTGAATGPPPVSPAPTVSPGNLLYLRTLRLRL